MTHIRFTWRGFVTVFSALYMLYIVIYVLDIMPMVFGKSISGPHHVGVFLSVILFMAFLILPLKKGAAPAQWYDIIFAILSLLPTLYYTIFFESILFTLAYTTPINAILGWLLIVLVWEAARRALGWPFAALIALALLYLLFGEYFPGILKSNSFSFQKVGGFMYVARDGIIGIPVNIASKIIITFLLFAQVLFVSGAGDWFVTLASSITGHVRGGPAKASVIASGGFGMITASPPANVASTGVVTIPLMKKMGFKPEYAAAVESVASTGGQIMPPVMGSVVFVLCEYIGMPYGQLIIYAFIPAILYYLALFIMIDLNAARLGIKGLPKSELPSFIKTAKQGWWYLLPILVLLYCLIGLTLSPEKSAIVSLFSLILISLFRKKERIGFTSLVKGAEGAMRALVPVAVACAGCGIIVGSLTLSLLSYRLTFQLVELVGQNMILILVLAAVISYIMGMGVGPLASYLTLAMMVAPAIVQLGAPKLAAHLFLFYWSITSFITPPLAIATFVAASIAGCGLWRAGFQAMRLGIAVYIVPFAFVYSPALLMIGSPPAIAIAVVTAIVGITALASGVEGYLFKELNWAQRILLIASGVYLVISSHFAQGFALAVIVAVVVWHIVSYKLKRPVSSIETIPKG